jgi:hypothetical protein
MRWGAVPAVLAVGLSVAGAAGGQTPAVVPALVFSDQAIQAQGMTPGGSVVWFGIGREVQEYAETLSDHQDVTVADAQGQATVRVAPAVPQHSLWVAVDLGTGRYAMAAPPLFPLRTFALGPAAVSVVGGAAGDLQ